MKLVAISKIAVQAAQREELVNYLQKEYFPYLNKFDGFQDVSLYQNDDEVVMHEYWDTLKNAQKLADALSTDQDIARKVWSLSVGNLERETYKLV